MFGLMPRRRERRAEGALAPREHSPLDLLRREFASLFDRAFAGWPVPLTAPWEGMELWGLEMEDKEEVVIRAEVPGFEASELDVSLVGDLLTIRAEHREEAAKEGGEKAEHCRGRLERVMAVPPGIVLDKVEARYRNGVLEVHLPKAPDARPRRIEVKV
jgi:HSP20 family protein